MVLLLSRGLSNGSWSVPLLLLLAPLAAVVALLDPEATDGDELDELIRLGVRERKLFDENLLREEAAIEGDCDGNAD